MGAPKKLFRSQFSGNDQEKVKKYKIYNYKLNKVKEFAKNNYFKAQFDFHKNNLKTTWKLIGMLVHKNGGSRPIIKG